MSGWLEILIVAFGAQLAVLPGEKVQFIIAGLSTRYRPLVVVGAAGLAFAGWTAVEIVVGDAIQGVLSPAALNVFTGALFVAFGVLLIRSMPGADDAQPAKTDGGKVDEQDLDVEIAGVELPDRVGTFASIFAMMAAGEVGDKTQLVTIGLAAEYGAHPSIWAGEMLAIIPVSLANAYFFNRFSDHYNPRLAHAAGAFIFFFFGFDAFLAFVADISVWETVVETVASALFAAV